MELTKNMKLGLLGAAAVILCLAGAFLLYGGSDGGSEGELYIVHTNDTHGHYEGDVGFENVVAVAEDLESEGNTVFVFDAGDFSQGTGIAMVTRGDSSINIMNSVGYDAVCPGNHELDYGQETFLKNMGALDTRVICSNLIWADTSETVFEDHAVLEKNGWKVGVFGLTSEATLSTARPDSLEGLQVKDPVETARECVSLLRDAGVDYVVAIGHIGTAATTAVSSEYICEHVPGIDLFVDGHSHDAFYSEKGGAIVGNTGDKFANIGVVPLSGGGDPYLLPSYGRSDAETHAVVTEQIGLVDGYMNRVVGHTLVDLDCGYRQSFVSEVVCGDFCTDAVKHRTGADIALVNGGGVRDSIRTGDITVRDLCNAFPFVNYIITVEVPGSAILEMLEKSFASYPEENGGFLQMSGMSVKWDPDAEPNHRVVSVLVDGQPLESDREYVLATNDYILSGGDGYGMMESYPYKEVYGMTYEVVTEYLGDIGEVTSVESGRLTAV